MSFRFRVHYGPYDAYMEFSIVEHKQGQKIRFAIQLQLNRKEKNDHKEMKSDQTKSNQKEKKVDVRAKKQTQQRWVPSAPCRGREHGREMVWIIIGHKSKTKQKKK